MLGALQRWNGRARHPGPYPPAAKDIEADAKIGRPHLQVRQEAKAVAGILNDLSGEPAGH
ncbi:hypothetical protein GCM10018772_62100 [Streptomyces fumanus]|uniref:Uncharacterized protein n=1 Tax=Streptomyces fumanus TaxID=67302 RepID=A0A919AV45_9ACTN|nr:hypothetical protein GCM10018772_62100 [Streptomyces fumanus]